MLQILIGGYFGSVLKDHYVALLRIRQQITRAAVYSTVTGVIRLAAIVGGALESGLLGVAVAMLAVSCAEGLYTVPALRRAVRADGPAA